MIPRKERYRMAVARICFVCRKPIPYDDGTFHGELAILTHDGACTERVDSLRRIHDRSSRGRWRPIGELLRLVEEQRC